MIVLDTNVVSALMQRAPAPAIVAWLDRQPPASVWTTAVTVFEIRFGLGLLPSGRRRRQLEDAFTRAVGDDFEGRVLPFDEEAARAAAERCNPAIGWKTRRFSRHRDRWHCIVATCHPRDP